MDFFTGTRDSSNNTSHSSRYVLSSDSFGLSPSENPSNYKTARGNFDQKPPQGSDLVEYLSAREIRSERDWRKSPRIPVSPKHVTFAADETVGSQGYESAEYQTVGDPTGNSNALPGKSTSLPMQYSRDKLLGTIDKLRQNVSEADCGVSGFAPNSDPSPPMYTSTPGLVIRRQSGSSDSASTESPSCGGPKFLRNHPGRGAMRHSYSARGSRKRDDDNQPVAKSFSSTTLGMRNQQIFNACMNSPSVVEERYASKISTVLPAVLEQTGPSPSVSSSSGISSDEGPGANVLSGGSICNPITEMLQEKYIFSQGTAERAVDCGDLLRSEEEERFKKLREEFRMVKGRTPEIKASVVESEVL